MIFPTFIKKKTDFFQKSICYQLNNTNSRKKKNPVFVTSITVYNQHFKPMTPFLQNNQIPVLLWNRRITMTNTLSPLQHGENGVEGLWDMTRNMGRQVHQLRQQWEWSIGFCEQRILWGMDKGNISFSPFLLTNFPDWKLGVSRLVWLQALCSQKDTDNRKRHYYEKYKCICKCIKLLILS